MSEEPESKGASESVERFPQTRWSLVLSLGGGDEVEAGRALAELCGIYW